MRGRARCAYDQPPWAAKYMFAFRRIVSSVIVLSALVGLLSLGSYASVTVSSFESYSGIWDTLISQIVGRAFRNDIATIQNRDRQIKDQALAFPEPTPPQLDETTRLSDLQRIGLEVSKDSNAGQQDLATSLNYSFTTNNTSSLASDLNGNTVDMTTGTTTLLAAGIDDTASSVFNIGFDFFLMGVRYNAFSVNDNGNMALGSTAVQAGTPYNLPNGTLALLNPFGNDLRVGTDGSVVAKVVGTAPNRVLVVQWTNSMIRYLSTAAAGTGTFQARIYETTGIIEYVYGTMATNSATPSPYTIGFSVNTTANNLISVNATTNTISTSTPVTTNSYSASSTITQLSSASNGSRRAYRFTPPVPNAPSNLTFVPVGVTTMTLNWTDTSSNEAGFPIYISTDNVNFSYIGTAAENATSVGITGLTPATTYYYRVYAVSEGALSSALSGSQATIPPTFCGTRIVGPSAGATDATIGAAYSAISSQGLACASFIELQPTYVSSVETFPLTLGPIVGSSSTNTLTIRPQSGASGRSITSANTTATINLAGATNVIFDGRSGGAGTAKELTIANTSTATGGTAVRFINDAIGNSIKFATLRSTFSSATSGVVVFSTTTGSNGNDNNTIDNCDIDGGAGATASPTSGVAQNGIYSLGTTTTAAQGNSGNTISNCNIFNNFVTGAVATSTGILLSSGNSDWTIDGNSFYQTSPRTVTTGANTYNGIQINNSSGNSFAVKNNKIGGDGPNATATTNKFTIGGTGFSNVFNGILMSVGTTTASTVTGNTIANISFNTQGSAGTFSGIQLTAGNATIGGSVANANTIGSKAVSSTSATASSLDLKLNSVTNAIHNGVLSSSSGTVNISFNDIGGVLMSTASANTLNSSFYGIRVTAGSNTIGNNNIGSTTNASNINSTTALNTTTNAGTLTGILVAAAGANSVTNNSISNLAYSASGGTGPSSAQTVIGISTTAGTNVISGNVVSNIGNVSANVGIASASSVIGISNTSSTASLSISGNTVRSISNNHSTAAVYVTGIFNNGPTSGTNLIERNFVHTISSQSTSAWLSGIYTAGGTSTYQNNMIAMGAGITAGMLITGIYEFAGTNNWYHNSVYIGGSNVATSDKETFALYSETTNTRNYRNNILFNARSRISGTANQYGIRVGSTTGLTSNHNVITATGTGGLFGKVSATNYSTIGDWRLGTSRDTASFEADPKYADATNSTPDLHLHPTLPTVAEGSGFDVGVADDFDGDTRALLTPVDIGADAGNYTQIDVSPPSIGTNTLADTTSTANRTLTVTITDQTGVDTASASAPRIWYRKGTSGAYAQNTCTLASGTAQNGSWNCVIDYTIAPFTGGSVTGGDSVQYYIGAQDTLGNVVTQPVGGSGITPPGSTAPASPNSYAITYVFGANYSQDFESNSNGWTTGVTVGTTTDWVLGNVAKTQITAPHSGTKAWATKLTGSYSLSTTSTLTSPQFDFSSLTARPTMSFWHNFKTEVAWDSGNLEYSINGGSTWTKVDNVLGTGGNFNTTNSTNWYNNSSTNGDSTGSTAPKWSGTSTAYTGHTTGWIQSTTLLPAAVVGQADVRFRWKFGSDGSTVDEGWAIDDVSISPPSAGVIQFSSASYSASENSNATVTVTRTGGSFGPVSVSFATSDGSGAVGGASCGAGVDYVTTSGLLSWADGDSASKTFNVALCADLENDPGETIILTLANATGGATIGAINPATLTINDVLPPMSGTYSLPGDYSSLTNSGGIFEALNTRGASGPVTINISSNLSSESGTIALNEIVGGYAVTLQQSGSNLIVSGNASSGLIRLNGADNVYFGCNSNLTFRNTASAPALTFINDATGNTTSYCTFESANTSTTSGTILFSTTTGPNGNSGNVIGNTTIRDRSDAAGVPANGVYSSGSTGSGIGPNTGNYVSNSSIFNFTNAGVLVTATGAGNGWSINSNSIYQTASRTTALTGISIQGGSGQSVNGNYIGGTAAFAGGANLATSSTFRGIDLSVGTTATSTVYDNVVRNIRSTVTGFTSSYGIFVQSGTVNVGNPSNNANGNTIGSANAAERFEINGDSYGIRVTSNSIANVCNNTINNLGTNATPSTGQYYFGMSVSGSGSHTVRNNTITNVTNSSTPDASFSTQTMGLIVDATGAASISDNRISNVGNTSVTTVTSNNNRVWGMLLSATGVGTAVSRNSVSGIFGSSPTTGARSDSITGIQLQSSANATLTNNVLAIDGGTASDRSITGILDLSGAAVTYQFNSANIYGTATGAVNTITFNRNSTTTVTLRNNIFANRRTGGTGLKVALANTNAAATGWSATASNNNLLFNNAAASLTAWLNTVQSLASFKTNSGGDAATISGDPLFIADTDLHIPIASPAVGAGVPFGSVTADIENDPRPAVAPDIGADELVQPESGTLAAGSYYNAVLGNGDTLGGDVIIRGTFYPQGISTTGDNTIELGCNSTVVGAGASNFVMGNVRKEYCAPGGFTFPVGTTDAARPGTADGTLVQEYSPATVNVTSASYPAKVTVTAYKGVFAGFPPATSLGRFWDIRQTGVATADIIFNYLDGDVNGSEANYTIYRQSGSDPAVNACGACAFDNGANTASITGVTTFSRWTLAEGFAPTAAEATLSGRVMTADGRGIKNAYLVVTGNSLVSPKRVITGPFGYYSFEGLDAGETYVVTVVSKRFTFATPSRVVTLNDSLDGFNFIADPME